MVLIFFRLIIYLFTFNTTRTLTTVICEYNTPICNIYDTLEYKYLYQLSSSQRTVASIRYLRIIKKMHRTTSYLNAAVLFVFLWTTIPLRPCLCYNTDCDFTERLVHFQKTMAHLKWYKDFSYEIWYVCGDLCLILVIIAKWLMQEHVLAIFKK